MPQATPEGTFAEAQQAIQQGNWDGFFRCLTATDLKRLLKNGISLGLAAGDVSAFQSICTSFGLSLEELHTAWATGQSRQYEKALADGLQPVADLPGLMAEIERYTRKTRGGGSVSGSLFAGDQIHTMELEGDRAWTILQINTTISQPLGFELWHGQWLIRLFAQKPSYSSSR
jgi:hypothetical protein